MVKYSATWHDGYTVVWRNLTWEEFNQVRHFQDRRFQDPMALYMKVYRLCRIEGPIPEDVPAGIVAWVGAQQMRENPFSGEGADITRVLNTARQAVLGNYLLAAQGFVAAAFHISFEEIRKMDVDTFFARVAQAELVLGRTIGPQQPESQAKPQQPSRKDPKQLAIERSRAARSQEREAASVSDDTYVFTRGTSTAPK